MNVAPNTPLQVSPMANRANAKSTEAMSKLINKFSNKIANINDYEQLEIIKSKIQVIVEIITVLQFNDDIAKDLNFTSNPKLLADYINNLFPPSNTGDIVQVFDENDTQQLFEICEHRNKWWSGNNDKLTRSATTFLIILVYSVFFCCAIAATSTSLFVIPANAEHTIIGRLLLLISVIIMFSMWLIALTDPTDVPPNFKTFILNQSYNK